MSTGNVEPIKAYTYRANINAILDGSSESRIAHALGDPGDSVRVSISSKAVQPSVTVSLSPAAQKVISENQIALQLVDASSRRQPTAVSRFRRLDPTLRQPLPRRPRRRRRAARIPIRL